MERYRIVEGVAVYFVTFAVVDWLPVFVSEEPCKVVTESLNFCVTNKSLRVSSYVIMPTHLHLIVFDAEFDAERLKRTLVDLRKFTAKLLGPGWHETASYLGEGAALFLFPSSPDVSSS